MLIPLLAQTSTPTLDPAPGAGPVLFGVVALTFGVVVVAYIVFVGRIGQLPGPVAAGIGITFIGLLVSVTSLFSMDRTAQQRRLQLRELTEAHWNLEWRGELEAVRTDEWTGTASVSTNGGRQDVLCRVRRDDATGQLAVTCDMEAPRRQH